MLWHTGWTDFHRPLASATTVDFNHKWTRIYTNGFMLVYNLPHEWVDAHKIRWMNTNGAMTVFGTQTGRTLKDFGLRDDWYSNWLNIKKGLHLWCNPFIMIYFKHFIRWHQVRCYSRGYNGASVRRMLRCNPKSRRWCCPGYPSLPYIPGW